MVPILPNWYDTDRSHSRTGSYLKSRPAFTPLALVEPSCAHLAPRGAGYDRGRENGARRIQNEISARLSARGTACDISDRNRFARLQQATIEEVAVGYGILRAAPRGAHHSRAYTRKGDAGRRSVSRGAALVVPTEKDPSTGLLTLAEAAHAIDRGYRLVDYLALVGIHWL